MKIELVNRMENRFHDLFDILEDPKNQNKTIKVTFDTKNEMESFRTGFYSHTRKAKIKVKTWIEGLTLFINKKWEVEDSTNIESE